MNIKAEDGNPRAKSDEKMTTLKEYLNNEWKPRSWEEINADLKMAQRVVFCKEENSK